MKKKEVLNAISSRAQEISKTEVTPKVVESVLEATSDVIQESLLTNDDKDKIVIPHIGTFKARYIPGGLKNVRNVQTGEVFEKNIEDRHRLLFKPEKAKAIEFAEKRRELFKK